MRVKKFKQKEIEEWLKVGTELAERIRKELGISSSFKHENIYNRVVDDLKKMGYIVGYDNDENNSALFNEKTRQSIPSILRFEKILLNENFSVPAQTEALFHEYIHIKASDALSSVEDILDDKDKLHNLENLVDITTYILTMPPQEIKKNLQKNHCNMHKILKNNYAYFEKCTVLQWISIHHHFACHFAWRMIMKGINQHIDYDNYHYDHENDPRIFKIDNVLKDPNSAAAQAVKFEKSVGNRKSFIGKDEYQCYAIYEKGLNRTICNVKLTKQTVKYDRLLVIGWKKSDGNPMVKKMRTQSKKKVNNNGKKSTPVTKTKRA